ncbi:unnamed protein product [Gadus morhua 'NCC']
MMQKMSIQPHIDLCSVVGGSRFGRAVEPGSIGYLPIFYNIMIFSVISAAWSVGGDVAEPLNQALSVSGRVGGGGRPSVGGQGQPTLRIRSNVRSRRCDCRGLWKTRSPCLRRADGGAVHLENHESACQQVVLEGGT